MIPGILATVPRVPVSPDDKDSAMYGMQDLLAIVMATPQVDLRTFRYQATDEAVTVATSVARPQFVAVNARSFDYPSLTVTATGIHWYLGTRPGEIIVTQISGLVTDQVYEVTLHIEGKR